MPTSAQVKVNTVGSTVRGNSNMVELTGYDATNRRGFKKLFFETKKDGGLTKNAETAQSLKQDDWVEITMDDSSYKNVQSIRIIQEPAGQDVPAQGQGSSPAPASSGGGGAKSDRMTKAEWAAKDRKKEVSVARSVAIKAAVVMAGICDKTATKPAVDAMEKLAYRIEAYLMKGAFDAALDVEVVEAVAQVDNTPVASNDSPPIDNDTAPTQDDDIPF